MPVRILNLMHFSLFLHSQFRAERAMELEALRVKVEADLRGRQAELDKLKDEVAVESLQMQELEEELRVVTAEYDVIMAKKREEELEIIRRRMDERNRERAAIKVLFQIRFELLNCSFIFSVLLTSDSKMVPLLPLPNDEVGITLVNVAQVIAY